MSGPLTSDDLRILREIDNETGHPDCIEAALARLDFLERKVQAAEVLVNMDIVRGVADDQCTAYDEVTE